MPPRATALRRGFREVYPGIVSLRSPTADHSVSAEAIQRAAQLIAGEVRETPVLPAGGLSRGTGERMTMKAECLQRTGSFKARGAFHKLSRLAREELDAGMVAASAGNHAQAVALAAERRGSHADLFMPAEAPLAKVAAVRGYGGKVHLLEGTYEDAAEAAREFADREGGTLIHPFDDPDIVAGQGTVGLEIAVQAPATRLVVVPLGGGGLASGVAIAIKSRIPGCRVIGVQAEAWSPYAHPAARPERIGTREPSTICDGIAVKRPGKLTLPLVERHLDAIVTVSDDEVAQAMVMLLERSKLVVEGAGAVGVAALFAGKVEPAVDGETCVVLSGGNVDASRLAECIRLGETAAVRRVVVWTVLPDRPGALAALLQIVAEHGANVVDVTHLREGVELHVSETAIQLVLQTEGREHANRILDAIRAEGFAARPER
jgi:threonine dehydratase